MHSDTLQASSRSRPSQAAAAVRKCGGRSSSARRLLVASLPALLLAAPVAAAAAESAAKGLAAPPVIYDAASHKSIWVDSRSLFDSHGRIDRTVVSDHDAVAIDSILAIKASPDGCIHLGPPMAIESFAPTERATLADAVKGADLVLQGRVVATAAGFSFATPGQLITILPERVFRNVAAARARYLLFVPAGTVRAGNKTICSEAPGYDPLPKAGEEVLVLLPHMWLTDLEVLRCPGPNALISLPPGALIQLARKYPDEAGPALDAGALLRRVAALASGIEP